MLQYMVGDFLSARLSAMFCTVCALVYLPFTCSVSLTLGKTLINSTFVAGNLFETYNDCVNFCLLQLQVNQEF